jgi:hypothetical protein
MYATDGWKNVEFTLHYRHPHVWMAVQKSFSCAVGFIELADSSDGDDRARKVGRLPWMSRWEMVIQKISWHADFAEILFN